MGAAVVGVSVGFWEEGDVGEEGVEGGEGRGEGGGGVGFEEGEVEVGERAADGGLGGGGEVVGWRGAGGEAVGGEGAGAFEVRDADLGQVGQVPVLPAEFGGGVDGELEAHGDDPG